MSSFEKYSIILYVLSLVILLAGFIVAIIQLHQLRKQLHADHEWNRRVDSLRHTFSDDPAMIRVLSRLDDHLKISSKKSNEISLDKIKKLSECDYPEINNDILFALSRLGKMCVAIKHKIADEEICQDLWGDCVVTMFRFFRQYIEDIRHKRRSNNIFENLEYFAIKWEKNHLNINDRPNTDE